MQGSVGPRTRDPHEHEKVLLARNFYRKEQRNQSCDLHLSSPGQENFRKECWPGKVHDA